MDMKLKYFKVKDSEIEEKYMQFEVEILTREIIDKEGILVFDSIITEVQPTLAPGYQLALDKVRKEILPS